MCHNMWVSSYPGMIKPHIQQDPSKNPVVLVASEWVMMMEIVISVTLLFVGIAVLIIINICVVGRVFRRAFLIEEGGGDGQGIVVHRARSSTSCGLSIGDLKRVPWFDYKDGEKGESSAVDCAVCLEGFKAGDKCRLLPSCHHFFHLQCVDLWLSKTPFCPICRASARPAAGDHSQGSGLVADELV